jgi:hypothetical protein
MPFYDTNPNFRAHPYEEPAHAYKVEQEMKHAAYMAQQQDRFQPIKTPEVSKPLDLASELQTYENLLGSLMEQLDVLENRLSPVLLDYPNYLRERDIVPDPMGSPVTTRVYHLNASLRVTTERVARITQSVNL